MASQKPPPRARNDCTLTPHQKGLDQVDKQKNALNYPHIFFFKSLNAIKEILILHSINSEKVLVYLLTIVYQFQKPSGTHHFSFDNDDLVLKSD